MTHSPLPHPAAPQTVSRPARRAAGLVAPSAFGAILGRPPADTIPLTAGSPDTGALPVAALLEATGVVLADPARRAAALDYSGHQGHAGLRGWIAAHEGVNPERVIIANGALHGLALLFQALIDPGETLVVENPVYPLTLKSLQLTGAQVEAIEVDGEGLRSDLLEARLKAGLRPRALYLVPDFHNPTGVTLSAARRAHLLALAEAYGFLILSDNPYVELRGRGTRPADFSTESDRVFRINTFSKTLGPGLRLGWVVVPEWARVPVLDMRARYDQHASSLTQAAVAELLERPGFFTGLIAGAAALYKRRGTALAEALEAEFGESIRIRQPEGGVFIWPEFTDPRLDVDHFAARAAEAGVLLLPGSQFIAGREPAPQIRRHARLSFGQVPEERLREAVRRLGAVQRELLK